jgi:hypothetical protein
MDLDDGQSSSSRANTRSAARAARGETNWNVDVDYSGLDREYKEVIKRSGNSFVNSAFL